MLYRWFYIIRCYPRVVFRLHGSIRWLITTELLNWRKSHNVRHFYSGYNHIRSISNMKIILTFKNPQSKCCHEPSLNSNSSPQCLTTIWSQQIFHSWSKSLTGFLLVSFCCPKKIAITYLESSAYSSYIWIVLFVILSVWSGERGFDIFADYLVFPLNQTSVQHGMLLWAR